MAPPTPSAAAEPESVWLWLKVMENAAEDGSIVFGQWQQRQPLMTVTSAEEEDKDSLFDDTEGEKVPTGRLPEKLTRQMRDLTITVGLSDVEMEAQLATEEGRFQKQWGSCAIEPTRMMLMQDGELILSHHQPPLTKWHLSVSSQPLTAITQLHLHGNRLDTVPSAICLLPQLEVLNVSDNNLFWLPDSLGRLQELKTLIVHDNDLRALPPTIGNCSGLRYLDVERNALHCFPASLLRLLRRTLQHVRIAGNPWQTPRQLWQPPTPEKSVESFVEEHDVATPRFNPPVLSLRELAYSVAWANKKARQQLRRDWPSCWSDGLRQPGFFCDGCNAYHPPIPSVLDSAGTRPSVGEFFHHRRSDQLLFFAWHWCGRRQCAQSISQRVTRALLEDDTVSTFSVHSSLHSL